MLLLMPAAGSKLVADMLMLQLMGTVHLCLLPLACGSAALKGRDACRRLDCHDEMLRCWMHP